MKFLAQTINGEIVHDFVFQLKEAVAYQIWWKQDSNAASIVYTELSELRRFDNTYIPVGTVEFVTKYLQQHWNKIPKPINVPLKLMAPEFSKRRIVNGTEKDIWGKCFVKSNNAIKEFTEITNTAPQGNYQISEKIRIDSEYRCFVYNNKLVGLQNYDGDFTMFPDILLIKEMIRQYSLDCPPAYTLDVGINKEGTFVIEVHDFFSCGLYGFADNRIYAQMLYDWFKWYVGQK